jgi:general secretion pathway protein D
LKASVQLLTGCVALGLTLPATYGQAMTPAASAWTTAALATGQLGAGTENRRAADDLLRQARKAIKEGQFDQADGLIAQAEKLNVKYDPLTARFVDTPEKLRKLLADERAKPAGGSKLPSLRFPALLGGQKTQAQPQSAAPVDPLAGKTGGVNPLADESKSKALSLLADGRKALAAGDKFAALAAWQKAAALPVQYGPQDDTPQRLAVELVQAGVDPAHLTPAAANPAAPYTLRPSDIDPTAERGPLMASQPGSAAPPQFAQQQMPANPYTLPGESNPLTQSSPSGAFQPLDAQPAPGYGPAGYQPAPAGSNPNQPAEPRRLPMGDATKKAEASRLVAQARVALDRGDLRAAQKLADRAQELNIPDEAFGAEETRPWQLALEINRAMYRREGVVQASGVEPAGEASAEPQYPVTQGVYDPNADTTKNMPASSQQTILPREGEEAPSQIAPQAVAPQGPGYRLYDEGLRALEQQDREGALQKFGEAWKFQDQLDGVVRQQLKDKLTFLRAAAAAQPLPAGEGQASPLEQVNNQQEVLRQKLVREIANEEKAAEALVETNPRGALVNLQKLRERVSAADVEPAAKKQLLTLVDRRLNQLSIYIEQNKSTIENDDRNTQIKADLVRNQDVLIETQNKLAEMVEQFNRLLDERRFAEAEVIARQARDLAPTEPVVINMVEKSRLARSLEEQYATRAAKENYFNGALQDVDNAAAGNVGDANPLAWGPAKEWIDLTRSRRRLLDEKSRLSPAELEIQKSLSKLVEVKFDNRPLAEVMDTLSKMAGVNVYLDPQGMHAEGVTSDTPVTLNLTQPISLRSALSLVLEPLGLGHVIQHEVLRITSEQTRDANTYSEVYYVADLVMPIPNFVPSYNIGLPGAIRESLNALGYGGSIRPVSAGPLTIAQNELQQQSQAPTGLAAAANPEVLAQAGMSGLMPAANGGRPQPMSGPGGLGGGVQADFDTLIELITTTIAPQSWDDVGGPGSISGFDTNLSLVVSQTQEVHEQIADLLEQLRRLQDLQVTIEVRFITLSDRFFERIGVDFDFNIDDNTGLNTLIDFLPQPLNAGANIATPVLSPFDDTNHSIGIGWSTAGPTADLDLEFNQGSFASTTPQFGNFDANSAANFGFAILSDIEVFFVLQAGQGDDRTNVLQAPKVTLFNGQQAFVSDTSQRPFVTSVIPVVGDFAAAHQPVIVVLNEGTSLSVQAVVSSDRRFVRLTLVPFFSQIGDVEEFTFNGKVTTDSGTVVQDPSNPDQNVTNGQSRTVEGTTVQLPTFAFTTVTTTVSVPDGGTVLLGGIKRLREGRTERGVPLLSKVPYISRLFKNVGIGRDAQSLMMMVTPRIIIQEEEEEKLGIELPQ